MTHTFLRNFKSNREATKRTTRKSPTRVSRPPGLRDSRGALGLCLVSVHPSRSCNRDHMFAIPKTFQRNTSNVLARPLFGMW